MEGKIRTALKSSMLENQHYEYIYELYESFDFWTDFKEVRITLFQNLLKENFE